MMSSFNSSYEEMVHICCSPHEYKWTGEKSETKLYYLWLFSEEIIIYYTPSLPSVVVMLSWT